MSTYLAPCSKASGSSLPPAPSLSLLPFALGPASAPYKTDSASTASFFRPRPCPPDVPGIQTGTPITAFRGRQLVGQTIHVPPGYKGYIVSAPQPHHVEHTRWPLTPAPSVASASTSAVKANDEGTVGTRRSPRKSALASVADSIKAKVRGAGQVALSKPKTRQTRRDTVKRKRYQFDSDEEADGGGGDDQHLEHASAPATATAGPKRARAATPTPTSDATLMADLPTIVVQEATPLKEPLPTPKKRLGQRGAVKESLPGTAAEQRGRSRSPSIAATPSPSASSSASSIATEMSESVIPSPATENDPPAFSVDSVHVKTDTDEPEVEVEATPTNARLLRPISTFDSFTLWTPDGPLPGFKADELEAEAAAEGTGAADEGEGVRLRRGWWRTGGAGEGGDEVVRALGEWIGLLEELNRPVYFDGLKAEDESDDEFDA